MVFLFKQIKAKKIIVGITFGAVGVIVGLLILLPTLINTDAIRAKIEAAASRAIGGQVDFEEIRLKFLPRPHVVISQGQMDIQDSVHGKWLELLVFPKLRALLVARIEVADLKLKQPDFELMLPISSRHKSEKGGSYQEGGDLRQQIKEGLGVLLAVVKEVEVAIDDGHLRVLEQDRAPLEWKDISARLEMTEKRVAVDLTCSFSFVQKIVWSGELDPSTLDLKGKVTLQGLSPHQLLTYWRPSSDLKIADGSVDLTLQFQSQDWRNWQGDFENRTSLLKVQYDTRQAEIGPAILKGRFNFSSSQMALQIDRLDLDNPQLSLIGKLLVGSSETTGIHLQVAGQNVNGSAIRATALTLAGHIPDVRKVFDIIKGGQIQTIRAEVRGKDWADLAAFEHWHIDGEMADGSISIPTVNLDLTDVYGHAIIENGILAAENIRANYRKTHGRQGLLKIGLVGDVKPFHLDIDVNADLAPLSSILNRVINNKQFKSELSRIEHLTGMGVGKLILGENLNDISVQIDVSEFNLRAHYNRLPYPLSIKGGRFQFKGDEIRVGDLRVQMQNTHFSKMSGRVNWRDTVEFEVQTGNGKIGSDFARWLTHEIKIPAQYHLKPPINFKSLDVEWNQSGEIAVAGSMTTFNGPTVSADMRFTPDQIDIRKLTIHDDTSNAEFVLKHKSKANITDLSFKGHLAKVTLDQFWKKNQFLEGIIKGDLQVQIDSKDPLNSVVKGNLEAHQVLLPFKGVGPLRIDHANLSASEKKLTIHEADIDWLGNRFELDGHLTFKPGSIFLEMNAAAEEIDVAKLETLFKNGGKKTNKDETSSSGFLQGIVHIDTERLKYGFYTWTPYRATLVLEKNSMTMQINEARLCGIDTPGTVKFSPNGIWLEIIPSSQPEGIQYTSGCLLGKPTTERMEGEFQVTGTVNTEGKTADELLHKLKGNLEITVRDGRIYNIGRVGIFTNIFSFLKINRLVEGDVPNLNSNDFPYKLLSIKFYIQDGKFILTEGYINGKSLNIVVTEGMLDLINQTLDFKLFVSPFTTVDTVVNKIPVIGPIFQGTLIAIPVSVKGDASNPKVTALSPSAFGARAMGIIERTLKAPVKIIEPVIKDKSNPQKSDNQEP